jgi:hypothetical protein
MCPYCHNAFMDAVERPRGSLDEDAKGLRSLASSYAVDMAEWFAYAKAHWTSIIGLAIGFLLIEAAVVVAILPLALIPLVGPALVLLAAVVAFPPFWAGMINVTLAQLKGDRWSFGDFFAGFGSRYLWRLLAFNFIMFGLTLVILTPVWVPILIGWALDPPVMQLVWFGVAACIIFVPVWAYVMVRISFFGPYLIIDRDFGPVEAIQESWDLTTDHFWGLFGVAVALALILLGGILLFGVGLLFLLPLTALVRSAGYLLAGGTRPPMKQPESW